MTLGGQMGEEFCGIVPTGARALLGAMNRDWRGLDALVTAVRYGVSEAAEDLDGDARSADRALQRYLEFLTYWGRELQWRVRYMESLGASPGVQRPWGVAYTIPFANHQQAARDGAAAGTADARRLMDLWNKYKLSSNDPDAYEAFRSELERMLNSNGMYRREPHYAGAFLRTFGAGNLGELLRKLYRPGMSWQADDPQGLRELPRDFAGLAELFATADRGGTLPRDVRGQVLGAQPQILATFLRAGGHTDQFALDAAKRILDPRRSPNPDGSPRDDWMAARHILLDELWRRPGVAQALLADPTTLGQLTDPDLLFRRVGARAREDGAGPVDYQYDLAAVLWRALDPTVGTPSGRGRVWATLIRANQSHLASTAADSPDVAKVLARRARAYFPYMAYHQISERDAAGIMLDGEKWPPEEPVPQPSLPPHVRPGDVANFLVALSRTSEGREELKAGLQVQMGDPLAGVRIEGRHIITDVDKDNEFQDQQVGLIAALYRGYRTAGLDREDMVDEAADILGAVVDPPTFGKGAVKIAVKVATNYGVGKVAEATAEVTVPQPPDITLPRTVEAIYQARVEHALRARLGHDPTDRQVAKVMEGFKSRVRAAEQRAAAEHQGS
jgi:hypothetical protein